MNILLFLWGLIVAHWSDILVVAIFVAALIVLWKRGNKALVKGIIKFMVIKAEKMLGSKTGELKKRAAYAMLPYAVRIFISFEEASGLIDDAAAWLKKQQEDKPEMNLLSYDEEVLNETLKKEGE